jgi:outer membrane protein assembly factor BamB
MLDVRRSMFDVPRVKSLLAIFLAIAPLRATDWPEFMGPTRDQVSTETGLIDAFPPSGPRLAWEKTVGTGYSAPSVRGGLLVLHHRVGGDEVIEAMDAKNGAVRWKFAYASRYEDPFGYNNGPRCTPLLTADRCYTFGAEGVLLCVDLENGKPVWRRDTQMDFEVPAAFFGVGSSPILEDGLLIAQVGAQPNSCVVAFDAATGKTVWENVGEKTWSGVPMTGWPGERKVQWNRADPTYEKQASYCTPVGTTIHGRRHVLVVTRQGLVSLDPRTGAVNFSFWFRARQNETVNAMTPVVSGDLIFLSAAYYRQGSVLLRVAPDGKSVSEVWRGLQLEIHWTRPVLHDGHLFAFTGRNEPDARFRCVELATGTVKWDRDEAWPNGGHGRVRRGDEPNVFGRGSAILADGKLIALGEAGLLGLFKPSAGQLEELGRWQAPQLAYPCWTAPVLAERLLYLRDESHLLCFDLKRPN